MDRRQETRSPAREAVLVRERSGRTIPALLIDLSARGARIQVRDKEQLPDVFDLIITRTARVMRCGVVWNIGEIYGLAELGALAHDNVLDLGSGRPVKNATSEGLIRARFRGTPKTR